MGAAYFGGVLRGLCASAGTPRRVDSAKPVAARLKPAGPRGRLRGRAVPGPTGHRLRSVDGAFFGVLESREAYIKFERFKPCFNETTLSKQNVTAQLSETREGRRRCDSLAREKNCCRDSLSRQTFDHGPKIPISAPIISARSRPKSRLSHVIGWFTTKTQRI